MTIDLPTADDPVRVIHGERLNEAVTLYHGESLAVLSGFAPDQFDDLETP